MKKILTLDQLTAKPGEKDSGYLNIINSELEIPATLICGAGEGPTALITGGIHNAEYVGIQAAIELAAELNASEVKGNIILVPLVNRSGFEHRTMSLVHEDGKNLNREFPGNEDGTLADRICHTVVKKLFAQVDYYIDLHSGDGYEELHSYAYYVGPVEEQVRETSFQMARRVEADCLVESQCTTGGAYNYASAQGIPSILLERGGRGTWSRKEVDMDKKDVKRILTYLGILEGQEEEKEDVKLVFREAVYENAPETGCWYAAFRPGEQFKKGDILGEIRDYFGNTIHVCRAREDGMILYQTASLNVLKDGPMVAYGVLK